MRVFTSEGLVSLRAALLATSALAPIGLAMLLSGPAQAACTVVGTGTVGELLSGDQLTCVGGTNLDNVSTQGGNTGIVITIGDGTTSTTVAPPTNSAVVLNKSPGAVLTVTNNAALLASDVAAIWVTHISDNATINIAAGSSVSATGAFPAIVLQGLAAEPILGLNLTINGAVNAQSPGILGSHTTGGLITFGPNSVVTGTSAAVNLQSGFNGNTVTISAGGLLQSSTVGGSSFVLGSGANNNTVNIGGTIVGQGLAVGAISINSASTGNVLNVLSTGAITALQNDAIFVDGAGNTLINAGAISGRGGFVGSTGFDTVVNSGAIIGSSDPAVDLRGGDDILELRAGYSFSGAVLGGANSDTLRFGGSANSIFNLDLLGAAQQFREFEQLDKTGTSTWILTGTSAFSGVTNVFDGTLVVNGSLANSIVSVDGGFLGGTGTVGGLIANNGGTVAPGNSIGTLNVAGNVIFNAGSAYQVEINAAGQSDKIAATGTATLNGGTVQILPLGSGFLANTQYNILTANGGVTGTFAGLAPLTAPLVTGTLTYDANNAYFLLQQVVAFASLAGQTPNQKAAAVALDQAASSGSASPALTTAIDTLAPGTAATIAAGLDDLAGQSLADGHRFATLQGAGFHKFVGNAVNGWGDLNRFGASPSATGAPMYLRGSSSVDTEPGVGRYSGWAGAWGNRERVDSTSDTFGLNSSTGGVAAGVDLLQTPHATVGVAIGGSSGHMRTAGRTDKVDSEMAHAALHATHRWAGFEANSAASFGYAWMDSSRSIGFLNQTAKGETEATTGGLSVSLARPFLHGGFAVAPFVGIDWFTANRDGFAETGAPGVNQIVASSTDDVLQGIAGVRIGYSTANRDGAGWGIGTRFAVRHDIEGGAPTTRTSLEGAPNIPFAISGADYARTAFIAGAQVQADVGATSQLRFAYEGEFSDDKVGHSVRGSLRVQY